MRLLKILFLLSFILWGCSSNEPKLLLNQLDQINANQVEVTLLNNGINSVTKQILKDGTFAIYVNASEFTSALNILNSYMIPSPAFSNFGEVFKKDSFISTPVEEHGRFIYALEQEISAMISKVNGVNSVKVIINIPQPSDNLWQDSQPKSSASVLIISQFGSRTDLYRQRIKELVTNAVPGISKSNVEVVIIPQKQ